MSKREHSALAHEKILTDQAVQGQQLVAVPRSTTSGAILNEDQEGAQEGGQQEGGQQEEVEEPWEDYGQGFDDVEFEGGGYISSGRQCMCMAVSRL